MAAKQDGDGAEGAANGGTLSDLAYQRILESLFEKRLPAGAFVSQNELVNITKIPIAPLRDALRVLEVEGVLTIHPRSGIEFVKPGLELTRATYQFRTIMERAAVRAYAETAEEAAIDALIGRHERLAAAIRAEGLSAPVSAEIEAVEDALHGSIIGILENPLVENSYRRVWNYVRLLRLDRKLTPRLALGSVEEHLAILAACRSRDPDRAEAALQAHFSAALQRSFGMF